MKNKNVKTVKIWGPAIRISHWLLAISIAGAFISRSSENLLAWHVFFGQSALALGVFRVVWGFIGGHTARFSTFLKPLREVLAFIRAIRSGEQVSSSPGHNPAAGWVMLAMMVLPIALGVTGLMILGGQEGVLPWAGIFGFTEARISLYLHRAGALLMLALIAMHFAGMVLHTLRHRENIALTMITGGRDKTGTLENADRQVAKHSLGQRAGVIALLLLGWVVLSLVVPMGYSNPNTLAALERQTPGLSFPPPVRKAALPDGQTQPAFPTQGANGNGPGKAEDRNEVKNASYTIPPLMDFQLPFGRGWIIAQTGSGQGAQEIPAVWTQECSPCHHAYHPSVLPTRSWEVMLDRLESHFKQNVWLDPETVLEMKDFVRKTSADTAPGELAAWLRVTLDQSQAPQRVTETWYWKEKHHDLGEKEFTTYPAKGRIECDRCHAFAERGSFEDTHILYPFRR